MNTLNAKMLLPTAASTSIASVTRHRKLEILAFMFRREPVAGAVDRVQ